MEPTFVNAVTGGAHVIVKAEPDRITVGGIVQLLAYPPESGTFDVEWYVVGPYMVSTHNAPISLLGTTTVTGNPVELSDGAPVRATLDTSSLTVGSWRVGIRLTRVDDDYDFEDVEAAEQAAQVPPPVLSGESDP